MADDKEKNNDEQKDEPKKPKKSKNKSSSGDLRGIGILEKIISVGIIIWLVSISYYAFAFFVLGMLPALLSIIIDRGSGRFASKTISACNFTGILPYLFDIGLAYEKDIYAKQVMADTNTWIVVYSFAGVGWLLIWLLPNLSSLFITFRADMRVKSLLTQQKELLEEWGEEVKTGRMRARSANEASDNKTNNKSKA
jgi:hypothetical protein